jgi:adenylate kinase family enzyme
MVPSVRLQLGQHALRLFTQNLLMPRFFRKQCMEILYRRLMKLHNPEELLYICVRILEIYNPYLVMAGAPGSGKTTTAKVFAKWLGKLFTNVSMSGILQEYLSHADGRAAFPNDIDHAIATMKSGGLVHDTIVEAAFRWKLEQLPQHGIVAKDGVVRNRKQFYDHLAFAQERHRPFCMIFFDISDAERDRRLEERARTEDRFDAGSERDRVALYKQVTVPMIRIAEEVAERQEDVFFARVSSDDLSPEKRAFASVVRLALSLVFNV